MSTAWFQQVDNSRIAKNALIEMNHLAERDADSRQSTSYASQNRKNTIDFANREAVDRNGTMVSNAVERNTTEDRITTLKTYSSEEHQLSDNFTNVLLASKENRITQAREVSDQKITGLKTQIEFEVDVINSESGKGSDAVRKLGIQTAQFVGDVQAEMSSENGILQEAREMGIRRVELDQLNSHFGFEKGNTFLAVQTERTQADTNRRLALDRGANDSRIEAVTAAATLQAAENRTKEILYSIDTVIENAEACCATKLLASGASRGTDGFITATAVGAIRDSLFAVKHESLMMRIKK